MFKFYCKSRKLLFLTQAYINLLEVLILNTPWKNQE